MSSLTATYFKKAFSLLVMVARKLMHLEARLRVVETIMHELEDHREVVGHLLRASADRADRLGDRLEHIEELDIIRMQAPDHEKYCFEGGEQ